MIGATGFAVTVGVLLAHFLSILIGEGVSGDGVSGDGVSGDGVSGDGVSRDGVFSC